MAETLAQAAHPERLAPFWQASAEGGGGGSLGLNENKCAVMHFEKPEFLAGVRATWSSVHFKNG